MRFKLFAPGAVLLAGFVLCTSSIYGNPDFAKKEKKACNFCHTKMTSDKAEMAKSLNDTGTCYKGNGHSLANCAAK